MRTRSRARVLWILAAATALYSLWNAAIYYTTESFGIVWFAGSVAVYCCVALIALVMSSLDTRDDDRDEREDPDGRARRDAAAQPVVQVQQNVPAPAAAAPRQGPSGAG